MRNAADVLLTILLALFVLACIPPAILLLAAIWLGDVIERRARHRLTRGKP